MDSIFSNSSAAAVLLSACADPNLRGPKKVFSLGRIIVSIQKPDISIFELYLEYSTKLELNLFFYSIRLCLQQYKLIICFLFDRTADPNILSDK